MTDSLDVLARYAPASDTVSAQWDAGRVLADILAPRGDDHGLGLLVPAATEDAPRFVPGRALRPTHAGRSARVTHWSRTMPAAVGVAALITAAAVLFAVLLTGGPGQPDGSEVGSTRTGTPFVPPPGLSDRASGADQYAYQVTEQIELDTAGKVRPHAPDSMTDRTWTAPDGTVVSIRTGSQTGCVIVDNGGGSVDFQNPTPAFFAALPTKVDALTTYLRSHAEGSSTLDQAVWTAVEDSLRTNGSMASPRLRAAMVTVLSRTAGVVLHPNQHDQLGRAALRVDFVDQRIDPGQVQAMYFDPTTFAFLEDRNGANGAPTAYNGPSPAYTAPVTEHIQDPEAMRGPAYLDLIRTDTVVAHLPTLPAGCVHG